MAPGFRKLGKETSPKELARKEYLAKLRKAQRERLRKWLVRPRARVRGALHARLLVRALHCLSLVQRVVLLLESSGVRPISPA